MLITIHYNKKITNVCSHTYLLVDLPLQPFTFDFLGIEKQIRKQGEG
jgi:hypothetical protein